MALAEKGKRGDGSDGGGCRLCCMRKRKSPGDEPGLDGGWGEWVSWLDRC